MTKTRVLVGVVGQRDRTSQALPTQILHRSASPFFSSASADISYRMIKGRPRHIHNSNCSFPCSTHFHQLIHICHLPNFGPPTPQTKKTKSMFYASSSAGADLIDLGFFLGGVIACIFTRTVTIVLGVFACIFTRTVTKRQRFVTFGGWARGSESGGGTRIPYSPCVSRQCPADGVWRIGELAGECLQTGSKRRGLPPQRAPLDTVYPFREHLNNVQRMVSGGYCEGLFPDTVCWTRLRNTWILGPSRISQKSCTAIPIVKRRAGT